jgi:hypothetical protein
MRERKNIKNINKKVLIDFAPFSILIPLNNNFV